MTNAERKKRILELVSRNRSVQITDLTELFDVSVMTIRRDLAELEEKKYIKRVYGGAVLNEEELNKPYFPRAAINSITIPGPRDHRPERLQVPGGQEPPFRHNMLHPRRE